MVVALDIHIFFDKSVVNRVVEGACLYKKERGLHGVGATLFLWLLGLCRGTSGYSAAFSSEVFSASVVSSSLLSNSVMPYSMRMLYHASTLRMSETRTRSVS